MNKKIVLIAALISLITVGIIVGIIVAVSLNPCDSTPLVDIEPVAGYSLDCGNTQNLNDTDCKVRSNFFLKQSLNSLVIHDADGTKLDGKLGIPVHIPFLVKYVNNKKTLVTLKQTVKNPILPVYKVYVCEDTAFGDYEIETKFSGLNEKYDILKDGKLIFTALKKVGLFCVNSNVEFRDEHDILIGEVDIECPSIPRKYSITNYDSEEYPNYLFAFVTALYHRNAVKKSS